MRCWRNVISKSVTPVPARTLPAGSRIASTRRLANGSTGCDAANPPTNEKEGRAARPSPCWLALAAREPGTKAIECRRRRVVVGHIAPVAEPIPDGGAVDDAAGANLADDQDARAGGQDAQGAIGGAGTGALPDDIGGRIPVSGRLRGPGRHREHDRPNRRSDKVDVARRANRTLSVAQIVGPVVFLNDRVAGTVDRHHVGDVTAPPGTALPAVPDGHRTDGRMGVDDVADRCRRRIPRAAIAEERGLPVRTLQRSAVKTDPFLAQPE